MSQWLKRGREGGMEALWRHPAPGPQPKLSEEHLARLPGLFSCEVEEFGNRGDVQTTRRVVKVIME